MKAQRRDTPRTGKTHLLVVEDEQDLRELLVYNLNREGFCVTAVDSGELAMRQAAETVPDLIVLDLMLPGIDGLEVCRTLKGDPHCAHIPIVMLTAKSEEADIVAGLELGADDYITKPFSPRVLISRLRAVLRRHQHAQERHTDEAESVMILDDLAIDPNRHEVRLGDRIIDLTVTEFKLLLLLARRAGRVFTRQQIIESLHGHLTAVTDRSVDVQVVALRRKLGERGQDIETVRGIGYRFREGQ